MIFSTSKYVFTHGKEPRGWGYWWFSITLPSGRIAEKSYPVGHKHLYSEAKRYIIKAARRYGASRVDVLP